MDDNVISKPVMIKIKVNGKMVNVQQSVEEVGPEMAHLLLSNQHNRNRRLTIIKQYSGVMEANLFNTTSDAIMLTRDNLLLNGQHRLEAVILSGKPQIFVVWRNCPQEIQSSLDQGAKRSVADVGVLDTGDSDLFRGDTVAMARRMVIGVEGRLWPTDPSVMKLFMLSNREAILFVRKEVFQNRVVKRVSPRGPVDAVLGRAFYHESKPKLKRFGEILLDGKYGAGEDMAFKLRDWLKDNKQASFAGETHFGRLGISTIVYQKTQGALREFLAESVTRGIPFVANELWLLPGEIRELKPGQRTDTKRGKVHR